MAARSARAAAAGPCAPGRHFVRWLQRHRSELKARVAAFKRQLQELNWIEGRNVHIDLRFGRGDKERLRANAQELIGLTPDVITANSAPAVLELARQTKVIPIVFANVFDPLGSGLVASLAQPGGNITGFSNFEPAMAGKWLELLKEIAPSVTRVTAMFDRDISSDAQFAQTAERLAPSLNLQYVAAPVSNTADIQEAINASARQSNCGLIVMGGTITAANREAIVRLAAQHRVPAIYANRYYVTMAEGAFTQFDLAQSSHPKVRGRANSSR